MQILRQTVTLASSQFLVLRFAEYWYLTLYRTYLISQKLRKKKRFIVEIVKHTDLLVRGTIRGSGSVFSKFLRIQNTG
jgi:hypothetical protein